MRRHLNLLLEVGPWIIGSLLLGVLAGVIGLRFRPIRWWLAAAPGVYAVSLFVFFSFAGGTTECEDSTCHPTAAFSDINPLGVMIIAGITALALTPLWSALAGVRMPSVVGALFLAVVLALFWYFLLLWVPAAGGVLAAAIAGPPSSAGPARPGSAGQPG